MTPLIPIMHTRTPCPAIECVVCPICGTTIWLQEEPIIIERGERLALAHKACVSWGGQQA